MIKPGDACPLCNYPVDEDPNDSNVLFCRCCGWYHRNHTKVMDGEVVAA